MVNQSAVDLHLGYKANFSSLRDGTVGTVLRGLPRLPPELLPGYFQIRIMGEPAGVAIV